MKKFLQIPVMNAASILESTQKYFFLNKIYRKKKIPALFNIYFLLNLIFRICRTKTNIGMKTAFYAICVKYL